MVHKEHPFYGVEIHPDQEEAYIKKLLSKYQNEPVTEELRKKVWDELQQEKYLGKIKIPFKVVMRRDERKQYPDMIEVILDTKL